MNALLNLQRWCFIHPPGQANGYMLKWAQCTGFWVAYECIVPAHAGNARCPAWNPSAAASALSKLGKYIDFLVFIHRVKSGGNHREPLSCFNARQLPCSVFKTFSPYLEEHSGLHSSVVLCRLCVTHQVPSLRWDGRSADRTPVALSKIETWFYKVMHLLPV